MPDIQIIMYRICRSSREHVFSSGQTQTPAKLTRRAVVLCKGGDRHSPHETTRLSVFNLLSFQYLRFCLYHHFILFAGLSVVQPTELQAFMANMAMFERAQGVQVSGGTFTINERRSTLEILLEKSAPGAFHNSQERFDAPKCHPDTRVAVVEDVVEQIRIAVVSTIVWLYGAAGAGKSSIAQTIAEMCSKEELLIGSFFFFRTASLRNNAQRLMASLAYQLGQTIPSTLSYIAVCIQKNPAIFESSLEDQLRQLFVQPLREAFENDPKSCPTRGLLVLDGLDECGTPKVQQYILKVLGEGLRTTPIPVVVLVASRPETHISSTFDSPKNLSNITTFLIGLNNKYDADADIRLYTNDRLKHVKYSHPFKQYISEDWPTFDDVELIVQKSSGQFIFAATIVRFVESISHKPDKRLRIALDSSQRFSSEVSKSPFAALDALYLQIFSAIEDKMIVLAILHHVLDIWPAASGLDVDQITYLFDLAPGDVEMCLSDLASLVKFERRNRHIRVYHASMRDFLLDEKRSQGFYLQQVTLRIFLSKIYLNHILSGRSDLRRDIKIVTECLKLTPNDEEISTFLLRLEDEVSRILCNYLVSQRERVHSEQKFWEFVNELEQLGVTLRIRFEKNEFWNQCIYGVHDFLKSDLQDHLQCDPSLELLTYMAFTRTNPPYLLSEWHDQFSAVGNACFNVRTIPNCCSIPISTFKGYSILQTFLLDESQSGSLAISPSHVVQTALKCAQYIQTRIQEGAFMPNVYLHLVVHPETRAIDGLQSLLEHGTRDDQLIKICQTLRPLLESFITHLRVADLDQALASYLKKYLPRETFIEDSLIYESNPIEVHLASSLKDHLTCKPYPEDHPTFDSPSVKKHLGSEVPLENHPAFESHLEHPLVKLSRWTRVRRFFSGKICFY
ncbi:hypothetical protein CPB83DRAFT_806319 [Crepidotus variabilis]|uniref:NACHT domain-containing protein n=1 Tax=Crepidotus variabilis TaxID=179855 RepID=A0A9P6JUC8_9AGAR|nr:hypothetical protein CPB83DRAFT_806319 [Crepidotus variabilis]